MSEGKVTMDVPVKFFIRFTRKDTEAVERALLIAKADDGREFSFVYSDLDGCACDLIIEDRDV